MSIEKCEFTGKVNQIKQNTNRKGSLSERSAVSGAFAAAFLLAVFLLSNTAATTAKSRQTDSINATFAEQKLMASDGVVGDQFGNGVAISGDTAVVGANAYGATVGGPGAAYVFVRSGNSWALQQKLTASDGATDDAFGSDVAISGDTIIVGAFGDTTGANTGQGSAYIFVRSGTAWTQQQKLTAGDGAGFDNFGYTVSIAGDTAVAGSPGSNIGANGDQGAAYVFTRSGTAWTQQQKLTAADGLAADVFGNSVGLAGDTVVVSAPEDTTGGNIQQGSAYVFTRTGTVWTQQQKLTASDATIYDYFGFSIAVSGDTVVIGTQEDIGTSFQQGSAYVFTRSGTAWTQQQKLTANDGAANDTFGNSVAIAGDMVIVSAAGDTNGTNQRQGSAYLFTRTGTAWTQGQKLTASDGAAGDFFGTSVSISGSTALVGAFGDTIGANSFQGSAYVFTSSATVSGRVLTPDGRNLRNAIVSLIDSQGVRRTATSSSFGVYSFADVRTGDTYTLTVSSKRYRFTPLIMPINDNLANLDFVGLE